VRTEDSDRADSMIFSSRRTTYGSVLPTASEEGVLVSHSLPLFLSSRNPWQGNIHGMAVSGRKGDFPS
jgi:hypothetical protein